VGGLDRALGGLALDRDRRASGHVLDVESRRFFLFGHTFNAQDAWLMFFPMSAVASR